MKPDCLVTGMHRSGTTLIGRMVELASSDISVLHEPFNYELGIQGVPSWYPNPYQDESHLLVQ